MITSNYGLELSRVISPRKAKMDLSGDSFLVSYKETTLKVKITGKVDLFHVLRKSFLNEDNSSSKGKVYLHKDFLNNYPFSDWDIKGPEEYWLKRNWRGELWRIHIIPTIHIGIFTIKEITHKKIK